MNMFYMLYPKAITLKGNLKFELNYEEPSYYNMIELLKYLSFELNDEFDYDATIKINTVLWDHQKSSVNKMFDGFINLNKRGVADSSNTGSGKSLTAIKLMKKLYDYNKKNNLNNYCGFLVLTPNLQLYDNWKSEIEKHTSGFDIVFQNANGSFTKKEIKSNSIVISSIGRARDHPINNSFVLVVVDECLTVSNNSFQTLQTRNYAVEAQFGVLLMSATFFAIK